MQGEVKKLNLGSILSEHTNVPCVYNYGMSHWDAAKL